jgi:hypothetical protein
VHLTKKIISPKESRYATAAATGQLKAESSTWKRLMSSMRDENINLKNRMCEILKHRIDKNLLEDIENFQTCFIKEDHWIDLLRNEVAEFDKLLALEIIEGGLIEKGILARLHRLRKNIITAVREFDLLKKGFNNYLLEMM